MAQRTPKERLAALKAWAADRRNKGLTPPVEVVAPGTAAPRRPSKAQVASVRRMVEAHSHEVANLSRPAIAALLPILAEAKREVARDLKAWIKRVPDG
jgi:hypothetical protein